MINSGRYQLGNSNALGAPTAVSVAAGGQFYFGSATGLTVTAPLSIAGAGRGDGTGALRFGGATTLGTADVWAGVVTVTAAGTSISAPGSFGKITGAIGTSGGYGLGFGTPGGTVAAVIEVANTNTYVNTTISGALELLVGAGGTSGTLGTGNVTITSSAGTTAGVVFNVSGTTTFGGTITGTGAGTDLLAVQGGGTLASNSATVSVGSIILGDNVGGNAAAGNLTQTGGSVMVTGTGAGAASTFLIEDLGGAAATSTYTLVSGSLTANNTDVSVGVDGNGVFTQTGGTASALGFRIGKGTSGTVNLNGGTTKMGSSGSYTGGGAAPLLAISGGYYQASANGPITVPMALGSDTIDTNGFTIDDFGNISGTGFVNKVGAGTLSLSGINTYAGGTYISNGTVASVTSSSIGSGTVTEAGGTLLVGTAAYAGPSVNGFGSTGIGWTLNGGPTVAANDLTITSAGNQAHSAWDNTKVPLRAFTVNFTYTQNNPTNPGDGFTFGFQNASTAAVGTAGNAFGYGGITPSFVVAVNLYSAGGYPVGMTFFQDGTVVTANFVTPTGGVSVANGVPINFAMTYNGTTFTVTLTQVNGGVTDTYTTSIAVNLPTLLGSASAFIGFTGGTGGNTATQDITNFNYAVTGVQVQPQGAYVNNIVVPASDTGTTSVVATTAYPSVPMGTLTEGAGATEKVTGTAVPSTDVTGFGQAGGGWTTNGAPSIVNDVLTLTTPAAGGGSNQFGLVQHARDRRCVRRQLHLHQRERRRRRRHGVHAAKCGLGRPGRQRRQPRLCHHRYAELWRAVQCLRRRSPHRRLWLGQERRPSGCLHSYGLGQPGRRQSAGEREPGL